MATIATIQSTDVIANSRTDINTNFSNLNSDKIETSYLDTDTALAANSDSKIATQKAVKAYVDAGGNVNASETARGIVEEATDAEVTAGTATGATGAKLIVTPAKLATRLTTLLDAKQNTLAWKNGGTTYDISTASGVQNIAHGLGRTPTQVKITGLYSTSARLNEAKTVYNGTTQSSMSWFFDTTSGDKEITTTFKITTQVGASYQTGVVTVDATNIIITWTKTGTPTGTANLMWEATG